MRLSAIFREAARNIGSGTTRAILLALLLGSITGSLAVADLLSVQTLETQAHAFRSSGAATRILQSESAIRGPACDALAGGSNPVSASGALSEADPIELAALPTTSIPAFRVTPGFVRLVGGDAELAGVWISDSLAETLAIAPGARLQTGTETVTIAGTYPYPDDGRDNRLRFAILVPVAAEREFDECWATAWPLAEGADVLLRSSAFAPGSSDALQIGQLNKTLGATFDGTTVFDARITKFVYPLIAGSGLCLGWASIRARRLEHAAALHAGQRRSEQLATILIETGVWVLLGSGVAAMIMLAAAIVTDRAGSVAHQPSVVAALSIALAALPVAFGAALLGAAMAASATRERHLFRYFKERR